MKEAYRSGDPYLAFAKQAGAVPSDATKATHKAVAGAIQAVRAGGSVRHGRGGLAERIGQPFFHARELLRLHTRLTAYSGAGPTPPWSHAMLTGELHTAFGWRVRVPPDAECPVAAEFPDAGQRRRNAAARVLPRHRARHRGCAPVHDAVLICAPLDRLEADIAGMRAAMAEASRIVLDGFELGTDVEDRPLPRSLHRRSRAP